MPVRLFCAELSVLCTSPHLAPFLRFANRTGLGSGFGNHFRVLISLQSAMPGCGIAEPSPFRAEPCALIVMRIRWLLPTRTACSCSITPSCRPRAPPRSPTLLPVRARLLACLLPSTSLASQTNTLLLFSCIAVALCAAPVILRVRGCPGVGAPSDRATSDCPTRCAFGLSVDLRMVLNGALHARTALLFVCAVARQRTAPTFASPSPASNVSMVFSK